MSEPELRDLNQLAMWAELARPIAHECNNFLNNLLLQLAISEKMFPESTRVEWANIRREGKKLAGLLQQWQRQRTHSSEEPARVELNQLIHETVEELRGDEATARLIVRPTGDSLWLTAVAGDVQRLLVLLLRYAIAALQNSGVEEPAMEIQLEKSRSRILLRLRSPGVAKAELPWADFDDLASSERTTLSLPALACKSLVDRIDGRIRIEPDAEESMVLTIDFPMAVF